MILKKGFVDLQINGYLGVDFSHVNLTMENIRRLTRRLVRNGTVAFCPTLVTAPLPVYEHNLPLIARAMKEPDLEPHLLGIHLEGPFISPQEGARGAHDSRYILPPDIGLFRRFRELADDRIVMITLAPEVTGADKLIRQIVREGDIVVSMGHHQADDTAIRRAVRLGARSVTHLGNGIPRLIQRHPNLLWTQLADDRLWGMFITDGYHLPDEFIQVALRAKTAKRFIVTSDSAPIAGMPAGIYSIFGQKVEIARNGRIGVYGTPYLAGSNSTMRACMNHLASLNLLPEADLWRIGVENPLRLIGKKLDGLRLAHLPDWQYTRNKFVRIRG